MTSREGESCWRALPRCSPCEMPVVGNVTERGPGVECLREIKPWDGRCYDGTGFRVSRRVGNGCPL
jgi:hypothetical protein